MPWVKQPAHYYSIDLQEACCQTSVDHLILFDNDEGNHAVLINRQPNANDNVDTCKNIPFLPLGSTVAVQHKMQDLVCMEE